MSHESAVHDLHERPNESEGESIQVIQPGGMSALVRSEIECQLDAAHRYRRSTTKFLQDAKTMATLTQGVAEACLYSLTRGGKLIAGPSVRLAEIVASCYGNLHVGARVIGVEDNEIIAQGVAWDLEKNLRTTIEVRRRITNSKGVRFNEDMITVTGNAAASIALRNAIFRVVPRAYVDTVYEAARALAVGDAKSLSAKRAEVLERLQKRGVEKERVLARLDRKGVDDIDLADLETLIGLGTAIKDGAQTLDEAFPPVVLPAPAEPGQDGKRMSMKSAKSKAAEKAGADPDTGEVPPKEEPKPEYDRGDNPDNY
jgi:hypothetical protein